MSSGDITIDGPPAPVPPAVFSRDDNGRTTVRSVRLVEPLRIDGRLDEGIYGTVPPITDFIQMLPREHQPASEKTEAWILYDDDNVYISARCWDTTPDGWHMSNKADGDIGVDAKFGVTANLTADFTYNTDFAQVEVDEQQVNLTRFSLFFPEKREFFLEGRGFFEFGRAPGLGGSGAGGTAPSLFYSRRIGLNGSRVVPIDAGGRLTGKAGKFGLGLMNLQTGSDDDPGVPATNFTVLRVKRDVLRRSSIGALFTNRSESTVAPGSNQAFGVDGTFSFFQDVYVSGYAARTRTPGLNGRDTSYEGRFEYGGDRYGLQLDHLMVGDHFNPEVGFLQRDNFRRSFALARFSPRPRTMRMVRKFTWEGSLE